jgi:hypothetical protein
MAFRQVMVAIPSLIFCSVEVSNWHLASNIIAGISEVLLSKADENLFSDTQELSYKCRDTPALAFIGCQTIIQTKRPRSVLFNQILEKKVGFTKIK